MSDCPFSQIGRNGFIKLRLHHDVADVESLASHTVQTLILIHPTLQIFSPFEYVTVFFNRADVISEAEHSLSVILGGYLSVKISIDKSSYL